MICIFYETQHFLIKVTIFSFKKDSLTVEDLWLSHNASRLSLSARCSQRVPIVGMYVWARAVLKITVLA